MNELSTEVLFSILTLLIFASAFFSSSETGLMGINRYRLRHLAKTNSNKGAVRAYQLLKRPDRLIGIILLGNNFVNLLASAIATIIALRLWGESGVLAATMILTAVILIFAEVTPKTLAAIHPERIAYPATFLLGPLLKLFYPIVWVLNLISNSLLRPLGVDMRDDHRQRMSRDELRTALNEAGALIPRRHQQMLLGILDLENVTVEDIMVPKGEIAAIDLDDEWEEILNQLLNSQHTRILVYRGDIDNVVGIIHLRNVLGLQRKGAISRESFDGVIRDPYFVPEGTPLNIQLLNFQQGRIRTGLVVDEYGDVQGLVTIDDILEEIVGEFTTDPATITSKDFFPQEDGTFLVEGAANIRELNRVLRWTLPSDGPKTLNGMILEYLETIPEPGTCLMLSDYPMEIVQTGNNGVKTVRIDPGFSKRKRSKTK